MTNKQIKLLLAGLLSVTAVNNAFAASSSVDDIISDQRSRQIARQISDNITRRVTSDIDSTFAGPNNENPEGASADRNSFMPDSLWSSFSWSRISNDDNNKASLFDVDVYQVTTGIDKNIGDFYFGVTLTYAGTAIDVYPVTIGDLGAKGSNHSVGLTPYLAYVINKNFFVSAMSGYNYSANNFNFPFTGNSFNTDAESDTYQSELDLNGLHVVNQWFMKGKIGTRYIHSYTRTDAYTYIDAFPALNSVTVSRVNQDSWTYLADSEIGYAFKNGVKAFTGVLYEYNSPSHAAGTGVFYYSAGVDYSVNKKLSVGTKVQTDLSNHNIDLTTVALTARLALD